MTNDLKMLLLVVIFTLGAVLSIISLCSNNDKLSTALHRIGNTFMLTALFFLVIFMGS